MNTPSRNQSTDGVAQPKSLRVPCRSSLTRQCLGVRWQSVLCVDTAFVAAFCLALAFFLNPPLAAAQTLWITNAVIHTVSGETIQRGAVLIEGGKISKVFEAGSAAEPGASVINLKGQHLYPGLIALGTALGLSEIDAVRATQDSIEVGDYTPEVQSWIAVNPDSELLPTARANGIAFFEPIPKGGVVTGQSALMAMEGWTYEQMTVLKPAALHIFWPSVELELATKERSRQPAKWKSLEEQAKERRARLLALQDFFQEAGAYSKAVDAAAKGSRPAPQRVPAWEAMLPYVRGELPIVIHVDDIRGIRAAVAWVSTNRYKAILAGAGDAWMAAPLLATNRIPVIFEHTFRPPVRDTQSYDVHFRAPELLRQAGVKVVFGIGPGSFGAAMARNLPYNAAQAVSFGFPREEALKALTLYPAQIMGVADRLGSIEANKDATFFACDKDILDLRSRVTRMWISGKEVSLQTRHTRLYDKYQSRPKPF